MRRILLATVSALALAGPAAAQGIPTYDNAQIIQRATQFIQTGIYWRNQAEGMANQLARQQGILGSLTGIRSLEGLAGTLNADIMRLPGIAADQLPSAYTGTTEIDGAGEALARNTYAEPTGDDREKREMDRRRRVTANVQANALTGARAAERRVSGLRELQAKANATRDVNEAMVLNNRIAAEQAYLKNEDLRLRREEMLQATRRDVDEMRDREAARQDAEAWKRSTEWAWGAR